MAKPRRMRSKSVALGLTLVAASALSGCAGDGNDYQGICVDPQTQVRLSDDACNSHSSSYNDAWVWFYIANGHSYPAVGQHYNPSTGVYHVPSGKTASKSGAKTSGGKVSRGGFGSGFGKSSS